MVLLRMIIKFYPPWIVRLFHLTFSTYRMFHCLTRANVASTVFLQWQCSARGIASKTCISKVLSGWLRCAVQTDRGTMWVTRPDCEIWLGAACMGKQWPGLSAEPCVTLAGRSGGCHSIIYCKHADATITIFPALKSEREFIWFCLAADGMLNTVIIQRWRQSGE